MLEFNSSIKKVYLYCYIIIFKKLYMHISKKIILFVNDNFVPKFIN